MGRTCTSGDKLFRRVAYADFINTLIKVLILMVTLVFVLFFTHTHTQTDTHAHTHTHRHAHTHSSRVEETLSLLK